jgi:NADH-quinone oxidoreductase subunit J
MSLADALFFIVAAVTAVSAFGVALSQSIIRSAVWLLFTLVGVSMLYLLLGAEFLSATQLIVYVGATMVLIVFGVMLTSGGPYAVLPTRSFETICGAIIALLLVGLTTATAFTFPTTTVPNDSLPGASELGLTFLGVPQNDSPQKLTYLLPFEIVSVHLLVVLIAAAYLARAKKKAGAA